MALRIDKVRAAALIRDEVSLAGKRPIDMEWEGKVERLSRRCAEGVSQTHIAFLGTSMLAKAMSRDADLFAIKPSHSDSPGAYSARTLCHTVLVPLAAEYGINIRVTGREPLNNQPYFRMTRLGDDTPVHPGGRAAFDYMVELVRELQALHDEDAAREALRAFIIVRQRYQPRYLTDNGDVAISPERLVRAIRQFVETDSEGGRRAQAVVAGLMDVVAGIDRVESGRINDPSRKYPGDVCVRSVSDPDVWEKAIEVRDKPVTETDVRIFGKKCVDMGVRESAVVAVAEGQPAIDTGSLSSWAGGFGIGLTIFRGWDVFVEQALYWAQAPKPVAASMAVNAIHQRLIGVEASPQSVIEWRSVTAP